MRADRLLNMLLLLQTRGRLTAAELAAELEVSERTIYRDLDALSGAGIPVYAERGPGGGCSLLDSYRTTLTGLSENEVRALFLLSVPSPLADLGIAGEIKTALLKLVAAKPPDSDPVARRIHLDTTWWFESDNPAPHLRPLYEALIAERQVMLRYRQAFGTEVERLADPYGLVAKAGVWYLVCGQNDRVRVHRVSHLLAASVTDEGFPYPAGFDLASFWADWCTRAESVRAIYPVIVRVSPDLARWLPSILGDSIREAIEAVPADDVGWLTLTLPFESLEAARARLLGWGGAVEVLAPEALRRSVADFAEQIVARYT